MDISKTHFLQSRTTSFFLHHLIDDRAHSSSAHLDGASTPFREMKVCRLSRARSELQELLFRGKWAFAQFGSLRSQHLVTCGDCDAMEVYVGHRRGGTSSVPLAHCRCGENLVGRQFFHRHNEHCRNWFCSARHVTAWMCTSLCAACDGFWLA